MNDKKYKITDTVKTISGINVYQIISLKDFADVHIGDLGGFVESEKNLSQEGNCWIYNNGIVLDNAIVKGNSKVYDSVITGESSINDDSCIKLSLIGGSVNLNNHNYIEETVLDEDVTLNNTYIKESKIAGSVYIGSPDNKSDNPNLIHIIKCVIKPKFDWVMYMGELKENEVYEIKNLLIK